MVLAPACLAGSSTNVATAAVTSAAAARATTVVRRIKNAIPEPFSRCMTPYPSKLRGFGIGGLERSCGSGAMTARGQIRWLPPGRGRHDLRHGHGNRQAEGRVPLAAVVAAGGGRYPAAAAAAGVPAAVRGAGGVVVWDPDHLCGDSLPGVLVDAFAAGGGVAGVGRAGAAAGDGADRRGAGGCARPASPGAADRAGDGVGVGVAAGQRRAPPPEAVGAVCGVGAVGGDGRAADAVAGRAGPPAGGAGGAAGRGRAGGDARNPRDGRRAGARRGAGGRRWPAGRLRGGRGELRVLAAAAV